MAIYTVGHSTRPIDDFLGLLRPRDIRVLADVRTVPGSRRHPQFGQPSLAAALSDEGIVYGHFPSLGGLRKSGPHSQNLGWKNPSFRAYADHMATPQFEAGVAELLELSERGPLAIMCAEAVPWKCHRSLLSDVLVARGVEVLHITSAGQASPHRLTSFAVVEGGRVRYPAPLTFDL
jgi:uncharacterized protein (DUF488 family)